MGSGRLPELLCWRTGFMVTTRLDTQLPCLQNLCHTAKRRNKMMQILYRMEVDYSGFHLQWQLQNLHTSLLHTIRIILLRILWGITRKHEQQLDLNLYCVFSFISDFQFHGSSQYACTCLIIRMGFACYCKVWLVAWTTATLSYPSDFSLLSQRASQLSLFPRQHQSLNMNHSYHVPNLPAQHGLHQSRVRRINMKEVWAVRSLSLMAAPG